MSRTTGTLSLPVNGQEVAVPEVEHLHCPTCDEVVLELEGARQLEQRAVALYREQHGLLSTREIEHIRSMHGLTQEELARLLRLGVGTISRWEVGRKAQSESMDLLLRLIRDLPGSIDHLRRYAA